ncbi:MAG TPA: hypothetical protein VH592_20270 [Gemmataceae bacterium]|jgi:hypothetical protein
MSVPQPQAAAPKVASDNRQITVISHSTLFYWWPVWAIGLLLGLISQFSGWSMAVVPTKTEILRGAEVIGPTHDGKEIHYKGREVLVVPESRHLPTQDPTDPNSEPQQLRHISKGREFGVLFTIVLLLVVFITNVPLRGWQSFMVIFVIVALAIIFALAGWWDVIVRYLGYLDIRINAGGYFFISAILFALWLFAVVVFDKQIYMVFTPGQFKVCTEIGGGEQTYSTIGLTLEKQRSDLFRHWILGLGSGDLIVKTTGAQAHHFEMPNVLFIGSKMQRIEDMVRKIPD